MDLSKQKKLAVSFLAQHHATPVLLLPNVWDALSARLFVETGFNAVATTSGGVAWALGYPDGELAPWSEVVAATARIARCVRVPVTADIEAGYGASPDEVGAHVAQIIQAGAVGLNLEDARHGLMLPLADAVARLKAARKAAVAEGVPIVLNARCDIFHFEHGDETARFSAVVERCNAYIAAGADCVYPFGLRDAGIIAAFVKAVACPVNITGRPGMPAASALEAMGVSRITVATAATLAVMDAIRKLAGEFRATGSFDVFTTTLRRPDVQKLFQLED